eukprot:gb/GEZN01017474.1/.p1 GENE.gb/GEZN01017474.1/~~gb/GEZN01017474.1/.p1  ORF type:complete len:191 (-),score=16.67 gb/GEZN01017474.1/:183-755(-)
MSMSTAKVVVCAGIAAYSSWFVYQPYLFYRHPISMIVAFLAVMPLSFLFEKSRAHTTHGLLMACSVTLMLYGFWAVWTGKEEKGKPHFWNVTDPNVSWHAMAGGTMILLLLIQLTFASVFMYPRAATPYLGKLHKLSGKNLFALAVSLTVSGWYRLYSSDTTTMGAYAAAAVIVVILAYPLARAKSISKD